MELLKYKPLVEHTLVLTTVKFLLGSHDSMSSSISPSSPVAPDSSPLVRKLSSLCCYFNRLVYRWCMTQDLMITSQLNMGIRLVMFNFILLLFLIKMIMTTVCFTLKINIIWISHLLSKLGYKVVNGCGLNQTCLSLHVWLLFSLNWLLCYSLWYYETDLGSALIVKFCKLLLTLTFSLHLFAKILKSITRKLK